MREYTDKEGRKFETILPNKLVQTVLRDPTPWYIDNKLKPAQEHRKRMDKIVKRETKLWRKMREVAIELVQQYKCQECGYIYDPEAGDPKIPWKELPKNWTCPDCGADKNKFKKYEEE